MENNHLNSNKLEWARLRAETLTAYGGKCACCGETYHRFLAIDHVNGNGAEERRQKSNLLGNNMYRKLRQEGWPTGYQVLCHNCNFAKGQGVSCPCQTDQEDVAALLEQTKRKGPQKGKDHWNYKGIWHGSNWWEN